jgi:hypothetical protein
MTISIKPTASGSTIEQDGSTILTVDGSGNITPSNQMYPKIPTFSARLTSDQSATSNVWTKVQLGTTEWDTDNSYDAVNYRWTPSVAGYYQINVSLRSSHGGSFVRTVQSIYKNGSEARTQYLTRAETDTGVVTDGFNTLIYLNGTDYIEMYVLIQATSPLIDTYAEIATTRMSGFLVSV